MANKIYPNPLSRAYLDGYFEVITPDFYMREGLIGRQFFPQRSFPERTLTWDLVYAQNPLAGIYTEGTRPIPWTELPFGQKMATMVHLMAGRPIDPNAVRGYRKAGEPNLITSPNDLYAYQRLTEEIRRAQSTADKMIETTIEYLTISAFQGTIQWPPPVGGGAQWHQPQWGNMNFTFDVGLRDDFKQKATTLTGIGGTPGTQIPWNDPNADPWADLELISEYITDETGQDAWGATIICSRMVLSNLRENAKVLARIQQTETGIKWLNTQLLLDGIQASLGYKFVFYDTMYTYLDMTKIDDPQLGEKYVYRKRFLPEGRLIILVSKDIGYLATAEVWDGKQYKAGKYTWYVQDNEPPFEIRLGIGGVFWPVITRPWSIFVFDAWS